MRPCCQNCNYCRMNTPEEEVAMYGRTLGYGCCLHPTAASYGATLKAPLLSGTGCGLWWSPLERPSFLPDGTPNAVGADHRPVGVQA
jgi:hypothetical protein